MLRISLLPPKNYGREKAMLSKGFLYRWGTRIKELGERMAHKRILGIPVLRWCCRPVIVLGLAIRDSGRNCPVADFSGEK
jgi:hypothetical protein